MVRQQHGTSGVVCRQKPSKVCRQKVRREEEQRRMLYNRYFTFSLWLQEYPLRKVLAEM